MNKYVKILPMLIIVPPIILVGTVIGMFRKKHKLKKQYFKL